MNKYLSTIMLTFLCFMINAQEFSNTLALVSGSSSTGKTTFCANVAILNPAWKHIDEYANYMEVATKTYKKLFPEKFQHIVNVIEYENVYAAIRMNEIKFKPKSSSQEKQQAYEAMQVIREILDGPNSEYYYQIFFKEFTKVVTQQIDTALSKGLNVIIDYYFIDRSILERYSSSCTVIKILLYTPFDLVVKNILRRNEDKMNLGNHRFFEQIFSSFSKFLSLTTQHENTIDSLSRSTVLMALNDVEQAIVFAEPETTRKPFSRYELTQQQFLTIKEQLLAQFKDQEVLYLLPKNQYDFVFSIDRKEILNTPKLFLSNFEEKHAS